MRNYLRSALRDLESAWWQWLKPEFEEPDATTPQLIADWVASHRHPAECGVGCQCEMRSEVT